MQNRGLSDKTRDFILPAGNIVPGPPATMEEARAAVARVQREDAAAEFEEAGQDMQALAKSLEPQRTRTRKAQETKAEEEEAQAERAPFAVFLRELVERGGEDESREGKTGLDLSLYRIEKVQGQERRSLCAKFYRTQAEAMAEGDPDLEGMTLDAARESGCFGAYRWDLIGWIDGERVLNTCHRINVERPAGYVPPKPAPVEPVAVPVANPLDQLRETLGLAGLLRESLGLGAKSSGMDAASIEVIKSGAEMKARLEMTNSHHAEIRDMEAKHRAELEARHREAFELGRKEGERDAREKYERQIWDLEHATTPEKEASLVSEITEAMGGPKAMQSLIGAAVAAMNRPPAPAPARVPAKIPTRPNPGQVIPFPRPTAPGPTAPGLPEPSRAEVFGALATLEEAAAIIRENPEMEGQDLAPVAERLEAFHGAGLKDGPLAAWWADLHAETITIPAGEALSWLEMAERIAGQDEAPETEETGEDEPMPTVDDLKALLLARLEEGAQPAEILEELKATIPAETLAQWRNLLRYIPTPAASAFLGVPDQHGKALHELLEGFIKS